MGNLILLGIAVFLIVVAIVFIAYGILEGGKPFWIFGSIIIILVLSISVSKFCNEDQTKTQEILHYEADLTDK